MENYDAIIWYHTYTIKEGSLTPLTYSLFRKQNQNQTKTNLQTKTPTSNQSPQFIHPTAQLHSCNFDLPLKGNI